MTTFPVWYMLGLCYGFVRGDDELTFRLCENEFQAKMIYAEPSIDEGFYLSVSRVRYRNEIHWSTDGFVCLIENKG